LSEALKDLQDFNWAGVSLKERVDLLVIEPSVKALIEEYLHL
jgi:hypothetical protein